MRDLIAWERVRKGIETKQANLAQASRTDYQTLRRQAKRGASGVPAEFVALEDDLADVQEKFGAQEVNVRTKLLEAYRVLAFPKAESAAPDHLFTGGPGGATVGVLLGRFRRNTGGDHHGSHPAQHLRQL